MFLLRAHLGYFYVYLIMCPGGPICGLRFYIVKIAAEFVRPTGLLFMFIRVFTSDGTDEPSVWYCIFLS